MRGMDYFWRYHSYNITQSMITKTQLKEQTLSSNPLAEELSKLEGKNKIQYLAKISASQSNDNHKIVFK